MLHLGRKRTLDALRGSGLWWHSMHADVKDFIKQCDTCAINKLVPHHGAMLVPPNGTKPWQVVSVDVVDLETTSSGNRKAVVFNDRFSRAVRAYAVPETLDSKMFLNLVVLSLIPDVGCPLLVISDRGSNLISALCKELYDKLGIGIPCVARHTPATCQPKSCADLVEDRAAEVLCIQVHLDYISSGHGRMPEAVAIPGTS
ncbi:hypothetical protein AB1Y20_015269 [Prymnesium parvum]|uniref:Integrase catalytic domain-containing protein n=1 Tax=Prymnesium parvum TaxID=97485 RepID=A0AB34K106_PRYPA